MSDNPLISVVIPVYKVENYLRECLDSVISQTYKNLDIILVDDGSLDNCPAICDEYAEKDSRIKVIHRQNGGLSAARNSGIDVARGEYITFIDSDDYVSRAYVEQLYLTLRTSGAGVAQCISTSKADCLNDKINPEYEIYSAHDAIRGAFLNNRVVRTAWGKLYPMSIFSDEGGRIRYPEGQTAEDLYVIPLVFDLAGSLALTDSTKYFFRVRNDSLWHRPFDARKLDSFITTSFLEGFLAPRYPDLLNYLQWDDLRLSLYILRRALQSEPEDSPIVSQIYQRIKKHNLRSFMSSPYSIKSKIIVSFTRVLPKKLAFKFLKLIGRLKGEE